jgi:hypothetical protein
MVSIPDFDLSMNNFDITDSIGAALDAEVKRRESLKA